MTDGTSRAILSLLASGHPLQEIIVEFGPDDVQAAAAEALTALESGPRIETRAERIERLQRTHPHAYAAWSAEHDAHLLRRWGEGARVAELARELGRQPGAVGARLERHLGPRWREQKGQTAQ